jgi:hypothetical protein
MTHKNRKGLAVAGLFCHTNVGKGAKNLFRKFPSGAVKFSKISVLFLSIRRIAVDALRCCQKGYPTCFLRAQIFLLRCIGNIVANCQQFYEALPYLRRVLTGWGTDGRIQLQNLCVSLQ